MKQLLLCILFLFSLSTQAQNWCPPGATWHFRDFNDDIHVYKDGTLKLEYTNTITINNILCKEIKGTFYGRSQWIDPNTYTVSNYVTFRTYEANNVAYLFNVNMQRFDTIANFNANIGDSWRYAMANTFCDDQQIPIKKVTVYDTGHVVINGMTLKKLVITPPSAPVEMVMVERIGGITGFMFMKQDCANDNATMGNFSCYSDNAFPIYKKAGVNNCIIITVGVQEQSLANGYIRVYPNPGNGLFKADLTQACQLNVFDALGKQVYASVANTGGIVDLDLTSQPAGIYFLTAQTESGKAHIKLVKQ